MKKHFIYIAASLFMLAGCAKNEMPQEAAESKTITVLMPEIATKTAFGAEADGKLPLVWNAGDKIAVAQDLGTESQKIATYVLEGEGGSVSGQFKYESGAADITVITDVVYPASAAEEEAIVIPSKQTYTEGSFDPKSVVMTWNNPDGIGENTVQLDTKASVICLMLKSSNAAQITKVKATLTYTDEAATALSYTLNCPKVVLPETAIPFYIAVQGSEDVCNALFEVSHSAITEALPAANGKVFSAYEVSRFPEYDVVAQAISADVPAIGSIYEGGVVFDINMDEGYVKIVSIDAPADGGKLKWSVDKTYSISIQEETLEDGEAKTNEFRQLSKDELSNYPAAEWCINKGEGWYMPAHGEFKVMNANLEIASTKDVAKAEGTERQNALNAAVVAAGGTAFSFGEYHWTCEETAKDKARYSRPCDAPQSTGSNPGTKNTARFVRAVKKVMITQ